MLVLSRKIGERIQIGDDIQLVVLKTANGRIQLGIDAPATVPIYRSEVLMRDRTHPQFPVEAISVAEAPCPID